MVRRDWRSSWNASLGRRNATRGKRGISFHTCTSLNLGVCDLLTRVQYGDLRTLLYDTAISLGAKVTFNARVAFIDPDSQTVTLTSGEIMRADVIVGADGVSGVSRQLLEEEDAPPQRLNMYR